MAFLEAVLANGALAVADLEVRARDAGLLGARQNLTDAKNFKAAKKNRGINSRRDGFGRGGEWLWELPLTPKTTMVETAADNAPQNSPAVYGGDHFRPDNVPKVPPAVAYGEGPRPDSVPEVPPRVAYDEGQNRQVTPHTHDRAIGELVPLEWVTGVGSLDPARAPRDVPVHRWRQLLNDVHAFMNASERWAERASMIGWDAVSLFGCHRLQPLDYLGSAGLLWHIAGGKLKKLYKDWAVIAAADGVERIFHRRPSTTTNVTLPWSLR